MAACSPGSPAGSSRPPSTSTPPAVAVDAPAPSVAGQVRTRLPALAGDAPPSAGAGEFCADYSAFDRIITGDGVDFSPEEAAGSARRFKASSSKKCKSGGDKTVVVSGPATLNWKCKKP